ANPHDDPAQKLYHACRGCGRPTGREKIIDQEYSIAGSDGIAMDLQVPAAVLEGILLLQCFEWKFPQLPDRHEAGIQSGGERGSEDESTRFDRDDGVDLSRSQSVRQRLHYTAQRFRIAKQ